MPSWIGPWEIAILVLMFWWVPVIFFLLTLQHALQRCFPQNRTMTPGLVWLGLIPAFNLVWQFIVVIALGRSLGNEYRARRLEAPSRPTQSVGLGLAATVSAFALLTVATGQLAVGTSFAVDGTEVYSEISPLGVVLRILLGVLAVAALVLLIIYWVKVHRYSSRLTGPQQWWGPYSYGSFCPSCGQSVPGARYCPHCGQELTPPVAGPPADTYFRT